VRVLLPADTVGTAETAHVPQRRLNDVTVMSSSLLLLMALAAAAFGQGAFFSTVRWFTVALIAFALALALTARALPVADLRSGFVLAGPVTGDLGADPGGSGGDAGERDWLGAVRCRNGCSSCGKPQTGHRLA
jgi:hypothetical protein